MLEMQPPRPPEPGFLLEVGPADLLTEGSELEQLADIWAADARAARAAAELAVWVAGWPAAGASTAPPGTPGCAPAGAGRARTRSTAARRCWPTCARGSCQSWP
ncbi:hypothetical protein [Geodermatophilus marinus]|uniref:hypothetical protein n=1 Tax=Geodermatophilus sp. LHW52908 TaxID=2303986 RepID=UPI001F44FB10|nr:hypothetical protein [Geodermatophilus sp. LHW52908]